MRATICAASSTCTVTGRRWASPGWPIANDGTSSRLPRTGATDFTVNGPRLEFTMDERQ
jgi:hypothetical protein